MWKTQHGRKHGPMTPDKSWVSSVQAQASSCTHLGAGTELASYLIEEVEKVQKIATKLVHGCKHLSYTERLKYLKLPALKYCRHTGDMIET